MLKSFSKRAFLAGMMASAASAALANAPTRSLRPKLRPLNVRIAGDVPIPDAIAQAKLGGKTSVAVVDLASGKLLESHGGKEVLPPASVAKVITALYALDVLGSDYRFQTRLIASGPVEGGIVQGDLILAGGGDPSLNTDNLNAMAQALAKRGIKGITGRFLVYGGALPQIETIDGGQPPHVGYSPAVSGICLNFNRVFFEWRNGTDGLTTTMDARSERIRPPVKGVAVKLSARAAPIYEYRQRQGREEWSVSRPALGGNGGRWLPVRKPSDYAGEVFRWLAARQGVRLPEARTTGSKPRGTVVASHQSAPLVDMARRMLRFSNNLTAECMGLTATAKRGKLAGNLRASGREMERWAQSKLGLKRAKFVDHSGLGEASRMGAGDLALALAQVRSTARLKPLLKLIELRDAKGRPYQTQPIAVNAKTGTLNFVSGLAGYMKTPTGQEFAFAVFSANLSARKKLSRAERERPEGARSWNRRARQLQQVMIERWGRIYTG